jgi:hypothetical protein
MKTITITWGEETFSPKPYTSVRVGPFSVTLSIADDADERIIMDVAYERLRSFAEREKRKKLQLFLEMNEQSGSR